VSEETLNGLETDPRFPTGKWTGFFVQKRPPLGRQAMELYLTFRRGRIAGEGRDVVGMFVLDGSYDLADGRCLWTKSYLGKHDVYYNGFNEGKGIWGTWDIPGNLRRPDLRGGFHIWPDGMSDPSDDHLSAEADLPQEVERVELVPTGVTELGVAEEPRTK
jgi:hypothetical protein